MFYIELTSQLYMKSHFIIRSIVVVVVVNRLRGISCRVLVRTDGPTVNKAESTRRATSNDLLARYVRIVSHWPTGSFIYTIHGCLRFAIVVMPSGSACSP